MLGYLRKVETVSIDKVGEHKVYLSNLPSRALHLCELATEEHPM